MDVSILVFHGCMASPSISIMDLLRKVAELPFRTPAMQGGATPPFSVRLVACGGEGREVVALGGFRVCCDATMDEVERSDLVIVPAFDGDFLEQLDQNRACLGWLQRQFERGAHLASICTGAFALAEAGLLDGRAATTHWMAEPLFRARYPQVELRTQQIIVDLGRICTSGVASSFMNLVIYLIEKYLGQATAQLAARVFLIDIEKAPQGAYAIFSGQKAHGDEAVLRAQALIEGELASAISVEELARSVAVSRRNFIRRFKRATGNTPLEYIQRVRVEAAKQALAVTRRSLAEVASEVGYQDPAAFRRIFLRETGISPGDYRRRYSLHTQSSAAA
jgi:transcriptional regulator GlxA family with amidase domain